MEKINFDEVDLVLRFLRASGVAGKVAKQYCKVSTVIYSSLYFVHKLCAIEMDFGTKLNISNLIFSV
jgi:hypothetical protein